MRGRDTEALGLHKITSSSPADCLPKNVLRCHFPSDTFVFEPDFWSGSYLFSQLWDPKPEILRRKPPDLRQEHRFCTGEPEATTAQHYSRGWRWPNQAMVEPRFGCWLHSGSSSFAGYDSRRLASAQQDQLHTQRSMSTLGVCFFSLDSVSDRRKGWSIKAWQLEPSQRIVQHVFVRMSKHQRLKQQTCVARAIPQEPLVLNSAHVSPLPGTSLDVRAQCPSKATTSPSGSSSFTKVTATRPFGRKRSQSGVGEGTGFVSPELTRLASTALIPERFSLRRC